MIITHNILEERITKALKEGREGKYDVTVHTTKEDLKTMGFEDVNDFHKELKELSMYTNNL